MQGAATTAKTPPERIAPEASIGWYGDEHVAAGPAPGRGVFVDQRLRMVTLPEPVSMLTVALPSPLVPLK